MMVNRPLVRHGFVLILLALVTGFLLPGLRIARLGLSAHTIGLLGGILLIAIGAVWPQFDLGPRQTQAMFWTWVISSYANWLGCLVGAITGAGRMTPIAADGSVSGGAAELVVAVLLLGVVVTSLVAVSLSLWGLRSRDRADA